MTAKRSWVALSFVLGTACVSGGCVAHAQAGGYGDANAPVFTEPPTLVNVDSDVWVVQDANDPVYYVDGYYWTQGGGVWRRARFYDKDWAVVEFAAVPASIARRDHRAYIRYHGNAGARTRPAPRDGVASRGEPGRRDEHGGSDGDRNRDKDEKADRKEDRKDEHADRKEDRKDEHADRKEDRKDRKDDKAGPGDQDHDGKSGKGDKGDRKDDKREHK